MLIGSGFARVCNDAGFAVSRFGGACTEFIVGHVVSDVDWRGGKRVDRQYSQGGLATLTFNYSA